MPFATPEQLKNYKKKNKKRDYRVGLLRKYGITPEQYAQMLLDQGGVCAICGLPETRILHGQVCQLCVDHDHETGEVRGLLCFMCNTTLGKLEKIGIDNFLDYLNY